MLNINFTLSISVHQKSAHIPYEFVYLLKATLAKMAGANFLNPNLINLDFWRTFSEKLVGIQNYELRTEKEKNVSFFFKKKS